MLCEFLNNLLKKICCCNIIIIKKGKHQKLKNKRNTLKNIKDYSPVSISENENVTNVKKFQIPTFIYIILSLILICFIIFFIIKIYYIIVKRNKSMCLYFGKRRK